MSYAYNARKKCRKKLTREQIQKKIVAQITDRFINGGNSLENYINDNTGMLERWFRGQHDKQVRDALLQTYSNELVTK